MEEVELAKVKQAAHDCLIGGEFLKAMIIPIKHGHFKGEFHVITNGGGRDCFKTRDAACRWASAYFLVASNMEIEP